MTPKLDPDPDILPPESQPFASIMRKPLRPRQRQALDPSAHRLSGHHARDALLFGGRKPYLPPSLVPYADRQGQYDIDDWHSDTEGMKPLLDGDGGDYNAFHDSDYSLLDDDDDLESIYPRNIVKDYSGKHSSRRYLDFPPSTARENGSAGDHHHDKKPATQGKADIDEATKQKVDLEKEEEEEEKEEEVEEKEEGKGKAEKEEEGQTGRKKEKEDDEDENKEHEQNKKKQETMEDRQTPEKEAFRGHGRDVPTPDQVHAFKCIKVACSGSCSKHCPTPNLVDTAAQDRLYDVWTHIESTLAKTGQEYLSRHLDELIELSESTGYRHRSGTAGMGSRRNATNSPREAHGCVPIPMPPANVVAGLQASANNQEQQPQHEQLQRLRQLDQQIQRAHQLDQQIQRLRQRDQHIQLLRQRDQPMQQAQQLVAEDCMFHLHAQRQQQQQPVSGRT